MFKLFTIPDAEEVMNQLRLTYLRWLSGHYKRGNSITNIEGIKREHL
jgi:hypothetical protein